MEHACKWIISGPGVTTSSNQLGGRQPSTMSSSVVFAAPDQSISPAPSSSAAHPLVEQPASLSASSNHQQAPIQRQRRLAEHDSSQLFAEFEVRCWHSWHAIRYDVKFIDFCCANCIYRSTILETMKTVAARRLKRATVRKMTKLTTRTMRYRNIL